VTYTIGVHYRSDAGLGPSSATVRVYFDGALRSEFEDIPLTAADQFCEVAALTYHADSAPDIVTIRTCTDGYPE